jgi:hypothetical protein
MAKQFISTPKPLPSPEVIQAFERGGPGQDTQTHIPANVVRVEPSPTATAEPTRRLSLDLPASLHRRFKTACSKTDRKMLSEVMDFIKHRTAELEAE